jgi:hypothetical protein
MSHPVISHEGAGLLFHIEEHPDSLQNKHILEHLLVPPVRVLYPDEVIQFQQDQFSIHNIKMAITAGQCQTH